ncbi:MAG: HDOD domain-containing protein [Bryobacterales bacterium]|nr:HDOD domain-containing protein [Bryobacterales bacterium]
MRMSPPPATSDRNRPWALAALPPLPAVALRLLELVSKEGTDLRDIVRMIESDPAFAVELLRAANSARFSFSEPVASLHQATLVLGLDFVKSLAITVALRVYVKNALKAPALARCWRHSLACALLSEELASASGVKPEPVYAAGLLHDVGRIGLLAAYPNEYSNMLGVSTEFGFDILCSEQDLFDIDHCQAGAWLAREWQLPEAIVRTAACHHQDVPEGTGTLSLVALGCRLADSLGYSVLPTHNTWAFEEICARLPMRVEERYHSNPNQLRKRISSRLESLM